MTPSTRRHEALARVVPWRWSQESLPISFYNLAGLVGGEIAMYMCVGLEDILATGDSPLEGNMSAFDTLPLSDSQIPSRIVDLDNPKVWA